jgi:hypothetical protein
MTLLDNWKQKFGETARAAAKKSGDLVEITKLNINIGNEEDRIRKVYYDIGRIVYDGYNDGDELSLKLKNHCEKIKLYEANIEEMKKKVRELKDVKECVNCRAELDELMVYCFKCGEKQPENKDEEEKPTIDDDTKE